MTQTKLSNKMEKIEKIEKQVQDFIDLKINEFELSAFESIALITYLGHRLTLMSACLQSDLKERLDQQKAALCMQKTVKCLDDIKKIISSE